MVIIITGGAGFIGSNFIFYLLKNYPNYRVVCVDSLTYAANLNTLKSIKDNANFRIAQIDIRDRKAVYEIFEEENPDIVVNFAAESHVDRSIKNPSIFFETNIIGTTILMDACVKYKVARFHQVSTDEVYGSLPLYPHTILFNENSEIKPSSPYSSSKASADLIVQSYCKTYGLPISISRCSNNYGPYQFPEKLIPLIIINAINDKPLPVYGNGSNIRDWIHVEDHCKAIDLIIHNSTAIGKVYNVGSNNEYCNIDIVKTICKELNKSDDLITFVPDRKGHDIRYAIDSTKIRRELGWMPDIKFRNGLRDTIQWYLDNAEWWVPLIK